MMTDDTDNLRLLALAATSRPMVAPGVSYAEGAALLRLLDRVDAAEAERDDALRRLHLRDAECAHMRAERDAARAELAEWVNAAQHGHPSPCTLGPLCPYCEIDRLRTENIELRNWRDTAVANCGKRRCSERDAEIQRMTDALDECNVLRELLTESLPELRGDLWHESRICSVCFGHNSHGDGCLVARIDAALRSE